MSLTFPGIDTAHLKKQAFHSRGLGSLSREEDAYRERLKNQRGQQEGYLKSSPLNCSHDGQYTIKDVRDFCKGMTADEIHEAMGREVYYLPNGKKILSGYGWPIPKGRYSFKDVGIDENELIKDVVAIHGDCDLRASSLENLGEVKQIIGRLYIPYDTKLKDISSVESVGCISKCTENMEDTVRLLRKIKFNPKEIRYTGGLYPERYLTVEILNGIKTNATKALKTIAASKIY